MKTSPEGVAVLAEREGVRLGAYCDSRGLLTIGVGHLSNAYFRVSPGMVISRERALDLLAHDLGEVEETINAVARTPLKQCQFDALASLGYNIGCGGLAHSTVVHFVNMRNDVAAANAFMGWDHPAVLKPRRRAEKMQFLGGPVKQVA